LGCPAGVAVGGSTVFVAGLHGGDVSAIELPDGGTATLATAGAPLVGIAADRARVYFTTATALDAVPVAGGGVTTLATAESATRPVTDGESAYFGDPNSGKIWKAGAGSATVIAAALETITDVAVADSEVYFGGAYIVQKVPANGGSPSTVGTAAGAPIGRIASDGESVYVVSLGTVWKLPAAGGAPIGLTALECNPVAVAVDDEAVYFTNAGDSASGCSGSVVELSPK